MKIIFTISALLLTFCVNAQTVNFLTENFNNGFPATWSRINNDGLIPHATVSFIDNAWVSYEDIDSTGIGDSVAVATSYYNPAGSADDWMISPPVTLLHRGNFLNWEVRSQDPSYPDGYDVLISTTPVIDSFYSNTALFAVDFEYPYWTSRSVSLDTFANQTVYIAFRAKSNDQFLLLIDNIKIYADTLVSVNENPQTETQVRAYPNPVHDFIYVQANKPVERAMLMDLNGKMIQTMFSQPEFFSMSLEGIEPGVYILYIYCLDGSSKRIKIIRS